MKLRVETSPSYDVLIEPGSLEQLGGAIGESRVAIVTDTNVAPLYLKRAADSLRAAGKTISSQVIVAGEASKSLANFQQLLQACILEGLDRGSAVLALGGGVVGDLAGFVAASLFRGVAFYQCPTSLLAMVDASIGGKTGVNLPEGKNLVGAFWQPKSVIMDIETLRSLPEREFRQGGVELFKHGLLADRQLATSIAHPDFTPDGPSEILQNCIGRSVTVKAEFVARDTREQGARAHLNLGHSLAHALEAVSHHRLAHGDAVSYGLLFVSLLSRERGFEDWTAAARDLLAWVAPDPLPTHSFETLLPYLQRDKKNRGGGLAFILLEAIGRPLLARDLSLVELKKAWENLWEVTHGTDPQRPQS